jgi:hypothetical protein
MCGIAQDFCGDGETMLAAGAFDAMSQIMLSNPTFGCAGRTTDEVVVQSHWSAVWWFRDLSRAGVIRRHINLVDVHDSVEPCDFQNFDNVG